MARGSAVVALAWFVLGALLMRVLLTLEGSPLPAPALSALSAAMPSASTHSPVTGPDSEALTAAIERALEVGRRGYAAQAAKERDRVPDAQPAAPAAATRSSSTTQQSLPSVTPTRSSTASKPSATPTRTALPPIPPQLPVPGEDRALSSHALDAAVVPSSFLATPPFPVSLLQEKLVIAVVTAVRGGVNTTVAGCSLLAHPWVQSFALTASPHMLTRFYFVYDDVDVFYARPDVRANVTSALLTAVEHWATTMRKLQPSALLAGVHWVAVPYTSKPAWAQSDGVVAAYKEGADYAYRTNDDSYFPSQESWMDYFVWTLRERHVPANVGVAGPLAGADPPWVFTHDFTHRTHAAVFGFHYPRALPTWSADDWVTDIYSDFPGHTWATRMPFSVHHDRGKFGTRYAPASSKARLEALNVELLVGYPILTAWLQETHGLNVTAVFVKRTCC